MELLFNMTCSSVWIVWCCLMLVNKAESLCERELLGRVNISTELQSDVLLPCNFNPALLGSDKTADIAVIWYQRNTTVHGLLEISLKGEVSAWDYKSGRMKAFPELSESGNFSILIQKVQKSDLSLYYCELFNGSSCSIAYQDVQLGLATVSHSEIIITGALTGALTGLLCFFIVCIFYICKNRRQQQQHPEGTRGCPYANPIYASYTLQLGRHSDASHNENPIYETICDRPQMEAACDDDGE